MQAIRNPNISHPSIAQGPSGPVKPKLFGPRAQQRQPLHHDGQLRCKLLQGGDSDSSQLSLAGLQLPQSHVR